MTITRGTRGEYAKTAERRSEILQAAVEVFSGSGFRQGSIRDVAERVGLSKAGVLHHYPTKNDLLEAVLAWRDEQTIDALGQPVPQGIDFIRAMVQVAENNVHTPGLVELHVVVSAEATAVDHPVHAYFVSRYRTVLDITIRAFQRAAEEGELLPGLDCASAARTLIALMDGLQIQWLLNPEGVDMAADLRRYLAPLFTVDL